MSKLALEYFLFLFVASCGVLQIAAAYSGLKGLMFFKGIIETYVLAALAIGGTFWWFFAGSNRNVPGLEGAQQAVYFFLAALSAIIFTFIVSSLVKARSLSGPKQIAPGRGFDALRETTYFKAVKRNFIDKG
mgnify:CR=1 FL=1